MLSMSHSKSLKSILAFQCSLCIFCDIGSISKNVSSSGFSNLKKLQNIIIEFHLMRDYNELPASTLKKLLFYESMETWKSLFND